MDSKAEHRIRMDAHRNRMADPHSVIEEDGGRLRLKFVASFALGDGRRAMIDFWAYSQEDAKRQVAFMRRTLQYEGLVADFVLAEGEYR
jgi:hypothetical protein